MSPLSKTSHLFFSNQAFEEEVKVEGEGEEEEREKKTKKRRVGVKKKKKYQNTTKFQGAPKLSQS